MSQQTFDPPRYEWCAETAQEALNTLEAAREMIDAHINTLAPHGAADRMDACRETPLRLTVSLDLSGTVARINDQRALQHLERELNELDPE